MLLHETKYSCTCAILLIALATSAQASTVNVKLSGGTNFPRLSNNTSLNLNNIVVNRYVTDKSTQTEPLVGLGASYTFKHIAQQPLNLNLGLSAYYLNLGKIKGLEHPFSNLGDFDTLQYQFNANSYSLMLEPTLVYTCYTWQPYVLAGIGLAWNRLMNYNESPSDPSLSAAPVPTAFKSQTITRFAYEVGLGVQHVIFNDARHKLQYSMALDYRYFNLGSAEFNNFPAITTGNHLKVSSLATQAIVFSLQATLS